MQIDEYLEITVQSNDNQELALNDWEQGPIRVWVQEKALKEDLVVLELEVVEWVSMYTVDMIAAENTTQGSSS